MAAKKGRPSKGEKTAGSGRAKGTKNKVTRDMREMVREAFEKAGGVDYLVTQADANPKAFITILAKLLPNTVEGEVSVKNVLKIIDLSE